MDGRWALHPAVSDALMPFWESEQLAFVPFSGTGLRLTVTEPALWVLGGGIQGGAIRGEQGGLGPGDLHQDADGGNCAQGRKCRRPCFNKSN